MDAKTLIQEYVDGWKENNAKKILDVITPDCVIIESHGPVYRGKEKVAEWINDWIKNKSLVSKWDIASFYEISPDKAAFEWVFECTVNGTRHSIDGVSIVFFKENKINYIREYRTTKQS